MTLAARSPFGQYFALDPSVTFLNHGSFGATPRVILDRAEALRRDLEREPVDFFLRRYLPLLDRSRATLARFLGADPLGLAFVANATTGVNCVLGSLRLSVGDELLVTDHVYNACRNALLACAERWSAKVVVAAVPFPLHDEGQVLSALRAQMSARTRLALIDHVTSPTGLILPLREIVDLLHSHGVDVLVDGAHSPGMVPLNLAELGVAWFVGNCHKWLCTPKGAGFLYARSDKREQTRPTIFSHGANAPTEERSRYWNEFDWIGSDDPAAWLTVGECIDYLGNLVPGGWNEIGERNRSLALQARALLCEKLQIAAPAPESMIGTLVSLPIPEGSGEKATRLMQIDPLQERLWREYRIEVPVMTWPRPPKRLLRVSAQLYNSIEEYELLAQALARLL